MTTSAASRPASDATGTIGVMPEENPIPPVAPGTPAPDLDALQALITESKAAGTNEATKSLLETLGFDKVDDLQGFVTAKRDADEKSKSEEQRRLDGIAAMETSAKNREAAAARLIESGVIREALRDAGVPVESLSDAQALVKIQGDITAETATAAVTALKAKPTLASLFTAPAPAAPSGVTGKAPANPEGAGVTGIERGAALYALKHPAKSA